MLAEPDLFSEEYYQRVITDFGYDTFDLRRFDFDLAGMSQDELNLRYLCHHHARRFIKTPVRRRVVTTGFGMSGPPHLATASHIMKMVRFQEGGEHCQIVLGDLDAYNGRARSHTYTSELAERFKIFAERLGFDSDRGVLRDQWNRPDVLRVMYLLGRYATDADFTEAEEDIHDYYSARSLVDSTMTFRRGLSLSLMAADFVTLGQDHDAVLVLLGIDEHKYVRFAQTITDRLDDETPLRNEFALAAVYARLNTGFNGHPKFSKSIPGSGISVETPDQDIYHLITSDKARNPASSPVFQLMYQTTYCSYVDLARLHHDCKENNSRWRSEKRRFADYLIHVKDLWP